MAEPLSGEIDIQVMPFGGMWPDGQFTPVNILVGNTGMVVVPTILEYHPRWSSVDDFHWVFHFVPEGAQHKQEAEKGKHALVFGYALTRFLEWWENPDTFSKDRGVFSKQPDFLVWNTNGPMSLFVENLLGEDAYEARRGERFKGTQFKGDILYNGCLYLDKLAQNGEARRTIKDMSETCEKRGYKIVKDKYGPR